MSCGVVETTIQQCGAQFIENSFVIAPKNQEYWIYYATLWCIFIIAYLSNPTSATFRTHLTSLSFHTHLRRLSNSQPITPSRYRSSKLPAHVLSFSNRISLSVATPPFTFKSYGIFAIVFMRRPPPRILNNKKIPLIIPGVTSVTHSNGNGNNNSNNYNNNYGNGNGNSTGKNGRSKPRLKVLVQPIVKEEDCEMYLGLFGKWYALRWWSESMEEEGRIKRLEKSVLALEAEDEEEEREIDHHSALHSTGPDSPISPTSNPSHPFSSLMSPNNSRNPRTTKRIRSAQRRPSPNSLARLQSQAEATSNLSTNITTTTFLNQPLVSPPIQMISPPLSPTSKLPTKKLSLPTSTTNTNTIGSKNPLESFLHEMQDPPGLPFQLVSSPKRCQSPLNVSSNVASIISPLSTTTTNSTIIPSTTIPRNLNVVIPNHQLPHSHFEYSSTIQDPNLNPILNSPNPSVASLSTITGISTSNSSTPIPSPALLLTQLPSLPLPTLLPTPSTTTAELNSSSLGLSINPILVEQGTSTSNQDTISDSLKIQLEELRTLAVESELRLQIELDSLRLKKKEEDLFRAELKLKTKGLEELKRIAELNKVEAERLLGERKAVKRKLGERIEKVREEIGVIERKEIESIERKEKKKKDRKERERRLKEEVERKKEDLVGAEATTQKVLAKAALLAKTIEIRKELLFARRNDYSANRSSGGNGNGGWSDQGDGVRSSSSSYRRTTPAYYNHYNQNNNNNSSRPASLNSDHFDYYATPYDRPSQPSSPIILSRPVSPNYLVEPKVYINSDSTNSSQLNLNSTPNYYTGTTGGGAFAPETFRPNLNQSGFLEHRIQHRRNEFGLSSDSSFLANPNPSSNQYSTFHSNASVGILPSVADIPANFLPFDFDSNELLTENNRLSMEFMTPYGMSKRPSLSLPMQYLDSGLLESSDSINNLDGPLSPMTPHQTSLIPSQLFDMLDEDDEDDYDISHSPTTDGRDIEPWKALGLDDMEPIINQISTQPQSHLLQSQQSPLDEFKSRELSSPPISNSSPITSAAVFDFANHSGEFNLWDNSLATSTGNNVIGNENLNSSTNSRFSPALLSPGISSNSGSNSGNSNVGGSAGLGGSIVVGGGTEDDLPRHELSLNPDAKAFAFAGGHQLPSPISNSHSTSNSSPSIQPSSPVSPTSSITHFSNALSQITSGSTTSNSSSPIISPNSIISFTPPPKSRMDFANSMLGSGGSIGSNNSSSTTGTGITGTTTGNNPITQQSSSSAFSRFTFDWGKTSPKVLNPNIKSNHVATASTSSFNPFDADDELLGPLKK